MAGNEDALQHQYKNWLYENYGSRGVVTDVTFEEWKKLKSK